MTTTESRPNVILVVTDDQGYGDFGCTGNPWIKTPAIDAFYDDAVRLTDFHVSPLCAPTRGALLTGRRPTRNGVWGVCRGRSLLGRDEVTVADIFAENGYRTGMFGKWHLGDNYPYRPFDRGFQTAVYHKGGGVGQTPDFWGNNYFDDTYFHNGVPVRHDGYCTDIWFDQAKKFIESAGDEPFFVYLATNAPHDPYLVDESYTAPYADNPDIPFPPFYGMIANIDENFAKLRGFLADRSLEENTIIMVLTDNGSSGGCKTDDSGFVTHGYNAGMRGKKGSFYEGGHRVPFFVRWPAGGIAGGTDVDAMTLHIDVLPTLIELCGLAVPDSAVGEATPDSAAELPFFDGESLAATVRAAGEAMRIRTGESSTGDETLSAGVSAEPGRVGERSVDTGATDRVHFVQFDMAGREVVPKWNVTVMSGAWRLVYGRELYNVATDPEQRTDLSPKHPEVVRRLRNAHEQWWAAVEPGMQEYHPIVLGSDAENPARLDAFDVLGDLPYVQSLVAKGASATGIWRVDVAAPGRYRFRLRRWPEELNLSIESDLSPDAVRDLIIYWPANTSVSIRPVRARLGLFGRGWSCPVDSRATEATFEIDVEQTGPTYLEAWFVDHGGEELGAYYVYVERISS